MFVDTNILVYATRRASSFYNASREALVAARRSEPRLCISRQVIPEYLAVVKRPQPGIVPFVMSKAIKRVEFFASAVDVLEDGPAVTAILLDLCRDTPTGGRQIHDANIVATMLAHGERRLLTFNGSDFARFAPPIEIIQP